MANIFSKVKKGYEIFKSIDLAQLEALSKRVDLQEMMNAFGKLDDQQLMGLQKMLKSGTKKHKELPPINGDFYELSDSLSAEDRELQLKVRAFLEKEVKPIVNDYWLKDKFPHELIPKLAELNICGLTYDGYGCPNRSFLMEGIIASEMGRIDASIATFFGVQSGLAMGSIYICGSDEQKQRWLPKMQRMELIGSFGLTEPEVGSAVAGGLTTTAKRIGDKWVLNG
ncbi:MAG: acyl-CoA dehydrogenase family protein, partial [Oligoflexus sp.]|nr:acyl-CoA dehydrogenase family protein [Pseudopedobacter sp.]